MGMVTYPLNIFGLAPFSCCGGASSAGPQLRSTADTDRSGTETMGSDGQAPTFLGTKQLSNSNGLRCRMEKNDGQSCTFLWNQTTCNSTVMKASNLLTMASQPTTDGLSTY